MAWMAFMIFLAWMAYRHSRDQNFCRIFRFMGRADSSIGTALEEPAHATLVGSDISFSPSTSNPAGSFSLSTSFQLNPGGKSGWRAQRFGQSDAIPDDYR
jgi:hypothetical protein